MQSSESQAPDRLRQILTVVAILGSFIINTLSNIYPLNGESIGDISNTQFAGVLITPANYAFAIWGLIYLGLIGFAVYQFLPASKQHPRLHTISYLLIAGCVAQSAWIYLFLSRLFVGSVVAMIVLLVCLIAIYQEINKSGLRHSWQDKWLLRIPFSIYLGWISVATVVNIALALYAANWNGWGISSVIWTVLMLIVSSGLGVALLLQRRDVAYAGVLIWAFIAIAVKRIDTSLVAGTAIGLSILLGVLIVIVLNRKKMSEHSN